MENRQPIADFRSWNDEMGARFNPGDYHERSFFLIRFIESLRIRTILRLLNAGEGDSILEIGCGAGNLMQAFKYGRVTGVDLSGALLRMARARRYETKCDLIQSYGESMPFKDVSFDKIYCSEVLEHVKDPRMICREANRVLKRDGDFVISVPNEPFIGALKAAVYFLRLDRILNYKKKYKFSKDMTEEWHLHSFSMKYLKKIIEDFFVINKVRYVPSAVFPVRIVVLCSKGGR